MDSCAKIEKLLSYLSQSIIWARSVAVITPPCHGGDHRFESGRARQYK